MGNNMPDYKQYETSIPFLPEEGFSSVKWAEEISDQVMNIDRDAWNRIRSAVIGAAFGKIGPEELRKEVEGLTDAILIWDFMFFEHSMLGEFAHQTAHCRLPTQTTEEEYYASKKRLIDSYAKFKDEEPDYSSIKPFNAKEDMENTERLMKTYQTRVQCMRILFEHPVVTKYLACPWFVTRRGETIVARLAKFVNGGKMEPLDESIHIYKYVTLLLGKEHAYQVGYIHDLSLTQLDSYFKERDKERFKWGFSAFVRDSPYDRAHYESVMNIPKHLTEISEELEELFAPEKKNTAHQSKKIKRN